MPLATGPSVWTRREGSWEGEGTPAGEAPGLHQPEVVLLLLSSIQKTGHGEGVFSPQEENNIQFGNGINKKQICCRGQYLLLERNLL